MSTKHYGIAIFHNIGDVLASTPIAAQLKHDDPACRITWFTSESGRQVLDQNPYIDELFVLPGDAEGLDGCIEQLRNGHEWTRFFTPAAYMNYDAIPGGFSTDPPKGTIFGIYKAAPALDWTIPFEFTFRLTSEEQQKARAWWNALPGGCRILVESEFRSKQSPWTAEHTDLMVERLAPLNPLFVFTGKSKPEFFDELAARYPRVVCCTEPFRWNAEFFNNCQGFIGVSSGLSCLTYSDYCRKDVPRIEITRGEHWGAAELFHHSELMLCYSKRRYEECLDILCWKLQQKKVAPDFTPRIAIREPAAEGQEIVDCVICGSSNAGPVRSHEVVMCLDCKTIYRKKRITARLSTPRMDGAARAPRDIPELETNPEYVRAQDQSGVDWIARVLGGQTRGRVFVDFNAGWGEKLHYARSLGFKISGFAAFEEQAGAGARLLDAEIQLFNPEKLALAENSIDAACVSGILEHLAYPFEFLEQVQHALVPDGVLYCTAPNFESVSSQLLQDRWPELNSGALFYFSPRPLRELLIQTGFYVQEHTSDNAFKREGDLNRLLKALRGDLDNTGLRRLRRAFEDQGYGETIRIIARKRGTSKHRPRS